MSENEYFSRKACQLCSFTAVSKIKPITMNSMTTMKFQMNKYFSLCIVFHPFLKTHEKLGLYCWLSVPAWSQPWTMCPNDWWKSCWIWIKSQSNQIFMNSNTNFKYQQNSLIQIWIKFWIFQIKHVEIEMNSSKVDFEMKRNQIIFEF